MTNKTRFLIILAASVLLFLLPLQALAAPPLQGDCAGNLLKNAGFEEGFSARGAGEVIVANGWEPWWKNGSPGEVNDGFLRRPEYKGEDAGLFGTRRIHSGNFAQKWFTTYATHNGGVYQRVAVPAGSAATLSAWAQVWSSEDSSPDTVVSPGNYRVSVGIDPTGGTDGTSPNVVWSEEVVQYNTWIHLTVQAKAQADAITVFLRGRPEYRNHFNDSYWDDICLTIVRPTPRATNTPKPTNTPTVTPIPPTPTPTATPEIGSIEVLAYHDTNANKRFDAGEPLVQGARFSLESAGGSFGATYTTDGATEPMAYEWLAPGTYTVSAAAPAGYVASGTSEWQFSLGAGSSFSADFGLQYAPTATPTRTPIPTRTATPSPTPLPEPSGSVGETLYGISGVLTLVLTLGVSVGIYMRRRQR